MVQENIELRKQNEDLKNIIDKMGYMKDLHGKIIERAKNQNDAYENL